MRIIDIRIRNLRNKILGTILVLYTLFILIAPQIVIWSSSKILDSDGHEVSKIGVSMMYLVLSPPIIVISFLVGGVIYFTLFGLTINLIIRPIEFLLTNNTKLSDYLNIVSGIENKVNA